MWLHVPASPPSGGGLRIAGFCSGIGMLERAAMLGLESLGMRSAAVVHCEWDAIAAAVLVALGAASGDEAPVWDDLATFDGRPWRRLVDIAVAGLPCPSFSAAGKHRGNDDARAWGTPDSPHPQFLRIVGEMQPAMVFLENVPEWVTGGHFRRFGDELCRLGYEIESPLFVTAESVGASHERERVFILAVSGAVRIHLKKASGRYGASTAPGRTGEELADGAEPGRQGSGSAFREWCGDQQPPERGGAVGDTEHLPAGWRESNAIPREEGTQSGRRERTDGRDSGVPLFATARPQFDDEMAKDCQSDRATLEDVIGGIRGTSQALRRFAQMLVSGMDPTLMPAIESGIRMVVDGAPVSNADLLRLNGNCVVPVPAALAFRELVRRAGLEPTFRRRTL